MILASLESLFTNLRHIVGEFPGTGVRDDINRQATN